MADEFVVSLGFKPIGREWHAATRSQASTFLTHILRFDRAYDGECMTLPQAEAFTDEYFGMFSDQCAYLTNRDLTFGHRRGWFDISEATFDGGVLIVDSARMGILWFEDED